MSRGRVNFDELFAILKVLKGREVRITQSITAERPVVEHSHATHTVITLTVNHVEGWYDGAHLRLMENENMFYEIALDRIVEFIIPEGSGICIVEHFENETARQTIISTTTTGTPKQNGAKERKELQEMLTTASNFTDPIS